MRILQDRPDPVTGDRLFTSEAIQAITAPMKAWFRPRFFGLENVDPGRPALFVMNHTIYGMLDLPLIFAGFFSQKGVMIRGLADRLQFMIPGLRDFETRLGAVDGTRENCARLMQAGEFVLVCPGGGREVCKRKGEAYKLVWKQRTGFVRMAIEYGYPLIPLASVGGDNAFSILIDANDIMKSPLGRLFDLTGFTEKVLRGGDIVVPIARGIGPTLLPRPEGQYFSFGSPIDTTPYAGRQDDKSVQWELRRQVAAALNAQIQELLNLRAQDTDVGLWRRVLCRI